MSARSEQTALLASGIEVLLRYLRGTIVSSKSERGTVPVRKDSCRADKVEKVNCFTFSHACPSRSHVSLANETDEAGSWNFVSDDEQNIPDDKKVRETYREASREQYFK